MGFHEYQTRDLSHPKWERKRQLKRVIPDVLKMLAIPFSASILLITKGNP